MKMKVFIGTALLAAVVMADLTKLTDKKGKLMALYEGSLWDGLPDGEGVAWYKTYTGKFKGGLYNGKGSLRMPGGASFVGKFKRGSPVSGKLTDVHGDVTSAKQSSVGAIIARMFGDCPDVSTNTSMKDSRLTVSGKAVDSVYKATPDGYYIGQIKKKRANKKGTAFLVSYNGTWQNGKWNGNGVLTYPGGYKLQLVSGYGVVYGGMLQGPGSETLFQGGMPDSFNSIKCQEPTTAVPTNTTTPAPSTTTTVPTTTTATPCKECLTESGEKCMFPFTINGQTFNSCTTAYDDKPWCPTRLDGSGNFIYGSDAFAYCSSDCPAESNPEESTCPYQSIGFPDSCQEQQNKRDKNILFLGNSYTSPLCEVVANLGRAAGYNVNVKCVAPGGVQFEWHATNSLGEISGGDWDVVVMQDQSQAPSFPVSQVYYYTLPHTRTLVNAIREKNSCTLPVFYQTWGKQNGDSQNCGNGNYFCTFEGIQDRLTESYNTFAYVNQPAVVAPAGEAWRTWSNRDELFSGDGSHASSTGTYLTACVMFKTIWGESPVGNSYQPVANSAALQRQAEMIVINDWWSYPRSQGGPPCPSCLG